MSPPIIFLYCASIIIAWFVGKHWERSGGKIEDEWKEGTAIVLTIFGGIVVVMWLLASLFKMIAITWDK